jgi:hypothetical protein
MRSTEKCKYRNQSRRYQTVMLAGAIKIGFSTCDMLRISMAPWVGMMARFSYALTLLLLIVGLLFAQQNSPESAPLFHSNSELVVLPFHVVRGKSYVPDLKRDDVVLLEDGKPRAFSLFESPAARHRSPLDLILLFDTTTFDLPHPGDIRVTWGPSGDPPPALPGQKVGPFRTYWDRDATYEFAQYWDDTLSRAILESTGSDIRIAVYRFDHQQLQRLCRSTSAPETLSRALRRLPEQIPANEAIPLVTLLPGRVAFKEGWPSWSMEAILATLQDSTPTPNAIRMLAVFSEGRSATVLKEKGFAKPPRDIAAESTALGIPVYPVVLNSQKYDQDPLRILPRTINGPGRLPSYVLFFEGLAEMTGGRVFHPSILTADTVARLLEALRNDGLSQYVAGFVPSPSSGEPRKHKLEVRLKSNASAKLTGGKKITSY